MHGSFATECTETARRIRHISIAGKTDDRAAQSLQDFFAP